MSAPQHEPLMAYVIVDNYGHAVFSAPTFERAMARLGTLLQADVQTFDNRLFRIQKVEAE